MSPSPVPAQATSAPGGRAASVRWPLLLGSVALAAGGYLAFSMWAGWRDVTAAASRIGMTGLAALLGLSALNYLLRFGRWQVYLRALGARVPWRESLAIYLAGFALTTTPGKTGEAIRSVFLQRHGVPYTASIAAFVSERLSDLIAIVVLSCIGLADQPQARPVVVAGIAACVGVLLLLGAGGELADAKRLARAPVSRLGRAIHHALGAVRAARRCNRPALLVPLTLVSLVAWSCEAWAFHLLLGWLGMPAAWPFAFFVYALSVLAGAASLLPGGLGTTEAVMLGLLVWAGQPHANAVAATVLIRLATLWFAVLLGLLALPGAARQLGLHGAAATEESLRSGGAA